MEGSNMGLMLNRRRVCGGEKLPYDYEVEWIGTEGNVVFSTDFVPNTNDLTFKGKYYFGGYTNNAAWLSWWNAYSGENKAAYRIIRSESTNNRVYVNFGTKATDGGIRLNVTVGETYTFTFTPTELIWNGTHYSHGSYNVANTGFLKIIGSPSFIGKMMGHFECYKDDLLVHEYVPVVKNGVGCIYDAVTNKLFYNILSGTPTVGHRI